ncbi:MAG: HNH endonuclease [Patescibacteria group bacterium]|jgi:hypothetical protein
MAKCIYCFDADHKNFTGVEHVLPQSFGTFANATPTLTTVCDKCNAYFGKELDFFLARESLEGVTRYRNGIFSSEAQRQKSMAISAPKTPEMREYGGVLLWIDGTTGNIMTPISQVHLKHIYTHEYNIFVEPELENLDWKGKNLSPKEAKIFGSDTDRTRLLAKLKTVGIDIQKPQDMEPLHFDGTTSMNVRIYGEINKRLQRAFAKILFNFTAHYIGYNEVMKQEWNAARQFIRYGIGTLSYYPHTGRPFWGNETERIRLSNAGYNVAVRNEGGSVCGYLQMFNLFIHQFTLVTKYKVTPEQSMRFEPGYSPIYSFKKSPYITVATYDEWGRIVIR